ncbi:C-terminal domain of homeodomain 1-domain-containing protein [Pisolithus thermaeus]|nr:C-terminal domain of homeodomain 1-domain-containing protein [Pisolithus thermaeus]
MLDDTIREQLKTAEADLLSALSGEKDLAVYHAEFSKLLDTISVSSSAGRLDTSTVALAQNVAMRVACIADCFVDIEHEYRSLSDGLHEGWRNSLAKHFSADGSGASHSQETLSADDTSLRHPNYLTPAYKWLLSNLHNPYPTTEVKEHIASLAGCSLASINSWFTSVRKRIGWTAICRKHFRNCRADAVDAAYRTLVKEDPSRTISSEVAQAFIEMKTTANGLYYSSTSAKSPFSVGLDEAVKDMIEVHSPYSDDNSKQSEVSVWETGDEIVLSRPSSWSYRRTSYSPTACPSSRHSRSPSPVPTLESSFSSESDDEGDVSPPIIAGQKRSTGPSDGLDMVYGNVHVRKRRRISAVPDHNAKVPSCDTVPLSEFLGKESPANSPKASSQVTLLPHRTRKRRLSDADGQCYLKRPRGLSSGPRAQAVSDPLPKPSAIESNINDWLNINFSDIFDIPPPVGVDDPDPSALWQVELFSDYQLSGASHNKFQGIVLHSRLM